MEHAPGRLLAALSRLVDRRARWFVGGWIALVAVLTLAVPSLETVAARDASAFLPDGAPSYEAQKALDRAFTTGGGEAAIFVVMSDPDGLGPEDEAYYTDLVRRAEADPEHFVSVTSYVDNPALEDAFVSKDGKATYFVVSLPAATGSPAAREQIVAMRDLSEVDRPEGLEVHITGPTATVGDMAFELDQSMARVTVATLGLITLILLFIYRRPSAIAVAVTTLGVTLGAARGAVALAGDIGILHVSTFTGAFMTGVVLGAGTDYAVFQISRYHEMRRDGVPGSLAVPASVARVNGVIAGSALTVIVATMSMALAKLGLFSTTGPGIALGVLVALLISLTFTPALMAIVVKRGWLEPRATPSSDHRWERVAGVVVGAPGRVLLVGLVFLGLLAAFYPRLEPNYDMRSTQPGDTDSNLGYQALADHFPLNELLPDYVVVTADHDLRNATDLAALEAIAIEIDKLPDVVEVRGITRPLGQPITEASVAYQAGQVGEKLGEADEELGAGVEGATELADGASQVADGARAAVDGTGQLLDGLERQYAGLKQAASGAGDAQDGARQLTAGARQLADGLDLAAKQTKLAVDGLGLVLEALDNSLPCTLDVACRQARSGLREIYDGERTQLLPGLRQAAAAARQIADGTGDLSTGLTALENGLGTARDGMAQLRDGQATLRDRLGELADGAERVAAGTDEISGSVSDLRSQLAEAARFLRRTSQQAGDSALGGFYLPAKALDDPRLALAGSYYLSPDGHTARFVVLGEEDSFGNPARERSREVDAAARRAVIGTPLADATLGTTGIAASNEDIHVTSSEDFLLIGAVALVAVFLILIWLLRGLVAPVMLIGTVVLSFAAAMGLSVLFWQVILGHSVDWTVASTAFIILVAVGSDYNLLMMKRMRDEAPGAERAGIALAVSRTGSVITTAGLIFAASMFAMLFSPLIGIKQVGFTIGMGLLLDTFVVRSIVVPSAATLFGRLLWWPGGRAARAGQHADRLVREGTAA